jgi:hypothetical protein
MLANPSFEIGGSGGTVFAGWNQFGAVGRRARRPTAIPPPRASGPNTGNWDVSGFWQGLDSQPATGGS